MIINMKKFIPIKKQWKIEFNIDIMIIIIKQKIIFINISVFNNNLICLCYTKIFSTNHIEINTTSIKQI